MTFWFLGPPVNSSEVKYYLIQLELSYITTVRYRK
jgi:hypothetical protein